MACFSGFNCMRYTYVGTGEGWLYLAGIKGMATREIVGGRWRTISGLSFANGSGAARAGAWPHFRAIQKASTQYRKQQNFAFKSYLKAQPFPKNPSNYPIYC
jgi:hypothetical protein